MQHEQISGTNEQVKGRSGVAEPEGAGRSGHAARQSGRKGGKGKANEAKLPCFCLNFRNVFENIGLIAFGFLTIG